ncbi:MAG: methionyl-tRNA formyltransferase [Gammaproteobacteria bacterium]|nr:methionyl-tRNA formyltransferase [Gammaproteobacteria bacterium]
MTATALRLAFAGTPGAAAMVLQALLERTPHTVTHVYTRPDRPAGRGRRLQSGPVKTLAQQHGLPVHQPASARELENDTGLAAADALIVVAYGLLLTPAILERPRLGCINLHFSLLPRWRGAAPVQRAILAGDQETGISLMQMDTGLDTGPLLAQVPEAITETDTTASLQQRLAETGADALIELLPRLDATRATPQPEAGACYAPKIHKSESRLDWQQPAAELARAVRAFHPTPVARAELDGLDCRIWEATVVEVSTAAAPGTVVATGSQGIDIATGSGLLRIRRLQLPGGKPLSAAEFLNGRPGFGKAAG